MMESWIIFVLTAVKYIGFSALGIVAIAVMWAACEFTFNLITGRHPITGRKE